MIDKKVDLDKAMKNKFQHLTEEQYNELPQLLQIFEELFDGALSTWKIDMVDFEFKEPQSRYVQYHICYQSYTNK